MKGDAQQELAGLQTVASIAEVPVDLRSYEELMKYLRRLGDQLGNTPHPGRPETREICRKILYALVHKIEVTPDSFRIFYYCGEKKIRSVMELQSEKSEPNRGEQKEKPGSDFIRVPGSTSLTIGSGGWI